MPTGKGASTSDMQIRKRRIEEADRGEPLNSQECSVQKHSESLYVCLTDFGAKLHSLSKGDGVEVHTYPDRIEIEVPEDGP